MQRQIDTWAARRHSIPRAVYGIVLMVVTVWALFFNGPMPLFWLLFAIEGVITAVYLRDDRRRAQARADARTSRAAGNDAPGADP
jgi:membrane protein implicated in regulation of membrane protease activity